MPDEIKPFPAPVVDAPEPQAIEVLPAADSLVLMPVMNIAMAKKRLAEFQAFIKEYLVPDEDYGTIPGTQKPTLLKPGADKLCEIYGLADDYEIESKVERFDMQPELFDYTVKCILKTRRDGTFVGAGFGSCNSYEGKYRWRESKRVCPLCNKQGIIRGKPEYGGGWLCWTKRGGCGAKFLESDEAIVSQKEGKELNEDIPTLKNTILKMAKKRAKVDAVIAATRSSGIFTQDMEDIVDHDTTDGSGTKAGADRVAKQKLDAAKAKQPTKAEIPPTERGVEGYGPIQLVTKVQNPQKTRSWIKVVQAGFPLTCFDNPKLNPPLDGHLDFFSFMLAESTVGKVAEFHVAIIENINDPSKPPYHNIVLRDATAIVGDIEIYNGETAIRSERQ